MPSFALRNACMCSKSLAISVTAFSARFFLISQYFDPILSSLGLWSELPIYFCTTSILVAGTYIFVPLSYSIIRYSLFFFQAEDGIRDWSVTGVQTCALPI